MAIYSGFSHKKWWFSIAMLVHQRVDDAILQTLGNGPKRKKFAMKPLVRMDFWIPVGKKTGDVLATLPLGCLAQTSGWQPRIASGRQGWNLKPTRVTRDRFFKKGKMRPSKAPYGTLDWLNFNIFLKCSSTSTYRPESPLRLKTEDRIEQPPKPRKCVIPSMIITNHSHIVLHHHPSSTIMILKRSTIVLDLDP